MMDLNKQINGAPAARNRWHEVLPPDFEEAAVLIRLERLDSGGYQLAGDASFAGLASWRGMVARELEQRKQDQSSVMLDRESRRVVEKMMSGVDFSGDDVWHASIGGGVLILVDDSAAPRGITDSEICREIHRSLVLDAERLGHHVPLEVLSFYASTPAGHRSSGHGVH